MLLAQVTAPETITAGVAIVAAFGLMLRWILSTLTQKLTDIAETLSELARTMRQAVEGSSEAHGLILEKLAAHEERQQVLHEKELHEMRNLLATVQGHRERGQRG